MSYPFFQSRIKKFNKRMVQRRRTLHRGERGESPPCRKRRALRDVTSSTDAGRPAEKVPRHDAPAPSTDDNVETTDQDKGNEPAGHSTENNVEPDQEEEYPFSDY